MDSRENLEDVAIRERQLEAHLLRSPDYLRRCNRAVRRQVWMLYIAIGLLIFFQSLFIFKAAGRLPVSPLALTWGASLLAVVNCLLLIRAKLCLRRLNDAWLRPEERSLVHALRSQRAKIPSSHLLDDEATSARRN